MILDSVEEINKKSLEDCKNLNAFVCQTKQILLPHLNTIVSKPDILIPLDLADKAKTHSAVGYPDSYNVPTRMKQTAFFNGEIHSQVKHIEGSSLKVNDGISFGMWIYPRSIDDAPFFRAIDEDKRISCKIKDGMVWVRFNSGTNSRIIKGQQSLNQNQWNFVGFSLSIRAQEGTVFVNNTYGSAEVEGAYTPYNENSWLTDSNFNDFYIGSTVVGSSPGGSFFGEVSCIQMYGRALTPPMMNAISRKCFVNETHPLSSPCPLNFKLIGSDCFKLSTEPLSFTEAEIRCTSHPDDSYHMKLAFPENIQIQETLAYMAKSKLNISKLWVGMNSSSG